MEKIWSQAQYFPSLFSLILPFCISYLKIEWIWNKCGFFYSEWAYKKYSFEILRFYLKVPFSFYVPCNIHKKVQYRNCINARQYLFTNWKIRNKSGAENPTLTSIVWGGGGCKNTTFDFFKCPCSHNNTLL